MATRTAETDRSVQNRVLYYGFVAAVVLIPLAYSRETAFVAFYPKLLAMQLSLLVMVGAWFFRNPSHRRSPFNLPVALLLAVTVLSAAFAVNRAEAALRIGQNVALGILFLSVLHNFEIRSLSDWLRPVVVVCALISTIGVLQYAGLAFLSLPSAGLPGSTLGYRNFGAMFAVIALPLGVGLLLTAARGWDTHLYTFAIVVISTYLVATRTRAAWVGLAVSLLTCGLALWKVRSSLRVSAYRLCLAAAALASGAIICAAVPPNMGTEGYETHSSEKITLGSTVASMVSEGGDKGRLELWHNTLRMVGENLLGVGAGNWQYVYPAYDEGDVTWQGSTPRRPHNDYLWIAAELGLPGLLLFIWVVALAAVSGMPLSAATGDENQRLQTIFLFGGLVAILVQGLFSFPSERITPSFLIWFILGVLAHLRWEHTGRAIVALRQNRVLPVAAAVLLTLSAVASNRAVAFDAHFARASERVRRGEWQQAEFEATRALESGVIDPQVYLIRGLARSGQGDHAGAVRDNQACLSYHPYLVNALNNLALAQNGLEHHEEALLTVGRLLEINPGHAEAYANRGIALRALERYDEALEAFASARREDPASREVLYHLGLTYEQSGRFAEAERTYTQALQMDSTQVSTHYRLGVVRQRQSNYPAAVMAFAAALSLDSGYLPAYYSAGECYAAHGDTALAIRAYEAFLGRWTGPREPADMVRQRVAQLRGMAP